MSSKLDEVEHLISTNKYARDCCVFIVTESWLCPNLPDNPVQLANRSLYHYDRNANSGKSRGGGLCVYIQKNRSTDKIIDTNCCPDLDLMPVRCRPFHLPGELVVIINAVYIPPNANISTAPTQRFASSTSRGQNCAVPSGVC